MSTNLVLLAILMFAVTYPSRAVGLLTPGLDRLPKIAFDYLQLVGPAVLAALAAVSVMVVVGDDDVPSFHIGIEWVAILAALAIVACAAEPVPRAGRSGRHRGHRAGGRPGRDPGLMSTGDIATVTSDNDLRASRRQLLADSAGIAVGAIGFGFVYGLSAREVGFSPIEAVAMSTIVFAGAAQFAAVGYVASGLPWPGIILLTALLNARHLLYSAALRPWLRDIPLPRRAVMAHLLTDESFALAISHFRRIGQTDERGYWLGGIVATFIPWNLATLAGAVLGAQIPDRQAGHRHHLPGRHDRFGGRAHHGTARAGRRNRRSRCRGRGRVADEPVDRDRHRRGRRAARRTARPKRSVNDAAPPGTLEPADRSVLPDPHPRGETGARATAEPPAADEPPTADGSDR